MQFTKEDILNREPKFVDLFSDAEDVFANYNVSSSDRDRYTILYAIYSYECYSGDSTVFGYDKEEDSFFQVSASHCSCYGLEDQWRPEPLSLDEINGFLRRDADYFKDWLS